MIEEQNSGVNREYGVGDEVSESIATLFQKTRMQTLLLCEPLCTEDFVVQSMPDASPTKWHLAHTTWFFETFVLAAIDPNYTPFDPSFVVVFNSYYDGVGPQFARQYRGTLSRPTVDDVKRYRMHVDARLQTRLDAGTLSQEMLKRVELGCHHEQQHQELLLTDIKHGLGQWAQPGFPVGKPYSSTLLPSSPTNPPDDYGVVHGGLVHVGHDPKKGFAFDSETPRHKVFIDDFKLARDVVRNADFRAFIDDGGYAESALWLSDGWDWVRREGVDAPLYWSSPEAGAPKTWNFTLHGLAPIDDNAPVCHVSFFEADAYARWANARLPTEQEWERAQTSCPMRAGTFLDVDRCHPVGVDASESPSSFRGMMGDVWEWTSSAYLPYPGFAPLPGALGEYNGKFMNGQRVLRGGSVATPEDHLRATYRNFFQPEKRWQFTGIRLAKDH